MTKSEHNSKDYKNHKPFPLRLGNLKTKLQKDAFHNPELHGNSIHAVAIDIIKNHYDKREENLELQVNFVQNRIRQIVENFEEETDCKITAISLSPNIKIILTQ